jgi:hypothetical protein
MIRVLVVLAFVVALGRAPARAESAHRWLGLEASPGWLNFGHPDANTLAIAPAGTVWAYRLVRDAYYWTPLQFSLGVDETTPDSQDSFFGMLGTEAGWRAGHARQVELGAAAGIGWHQIAYSNNCDGSCTVGGGPIVISPIARLGLYADDRLALGAFTRMVIGVPLRASELDALGASWMFGMYIQGP